MRGRKMFLVPIFKDLRVQKLLRRPITIIGFEEDRIAEVTLIEKSDILCDVCNTPVATIQEEAEGGRTVGYVLCNGVYIYEVVCEDCRKRYFPRLKIYNDLEEADIAGDR
jgi:hypothetical protein